MNDCPNAEIRDRLPDLLHERLDASTRAQVMAHVAGCADCRAELELLRGMRGVLGAATPKVDINAIVAALPKPQRQANSADDARTVVPIGSRRRHRTWVDWRVAAAATIVAVGGGSFALLRHDAQLQTVSPRSDSVVAVAPITTPATQSPNAPVASAPSGSVSVAPTKKEPSEAPRLPDLNPPSSVSKTVAEVSEPGTLGGSSGQISNISKQQLKSLLDDIDRMPAVPLTDVEPAAIRVDVKTSSSSSEGM